MDGLFTATGKCAMLKTGDGRYAIVYNPSPDGQHRWPLAAIVSEDGYTYSHLACVCGEVPPMRYGGYLKDFGPQYVRGIMPGNDDSPDGYTWLAYSMNKEDIWVLRLPPRLEWRENRPVREVFSQMPGPPPKPPSSGHNGYDESPANTPCPYGRCTGRPFHRPALWQAHD